MTKNSYLAAELDEQISWFDKESTKHKNLHRRFRYSVFLLTALATVLAGLPVVFPDYQLICSLLILVATSTLTVINALEGLRKSAELWIHERTTLYRLRDIRRDLNFYSEDQTKSVDVDALYDKLQETLQSSRDQWIRLTERIPSKTDRTAGDSNQRGEPA